MKTPPSQCQPSHEDLILDQFTRQAEAFATSPAITNAAALDLLVKLSGAGPTDTVLDVACGAGVVVCAFAEVVRHVAGIDLTPAMIERARVLQQEKHLTNVSWQIGDVLSLPYADASFSIVTSRYAFHHLENPGAVLAEMKRVCAPGGKVVLADMYASSNPEKAAAFNRMEKLRDPSHVRTMPLSELNELLQQAGLRLIQTEFYCVEFELENLLQGSSPNPGDADRVRQMFVAELEENKMDIQVRREGLQIHFTYPITILVAENR